MSSYLVLSGAGVALLLSFMLSFATSIIATFGIFKAGLPVSVPKLDALWIQPGDSSSRSILMPGDAIDVFLPAASLAAAFAFSAGFLELVNPGC